MADRLDNPKKEMFKGLRNKRLTFLVLAVVALFLLLVIGGVILANLNSGRGVQSEYYDIDNSETAALEMKIGYERNCDGKEDCNLDQRSYNFLVFVFNNEGKQVRIIRGDNNGDFKTSLPEGWYTLVVSKTFENIPGLPQEVVELKKGSALKLHVDYGKEVSL